MIRRTPTEFPNQIEGMIILLRFEEWGQGARVVQRPVKTAELFASPVPLQKRRIPEGEPKRLSKKNEAGEYRNGGMDTGLFHVSRPKMTKYLLHHGRTSVIRSPP